MVAIVNYGTGNLRSVENALRRLGAAYCVTADPAAIAAADRVLLPGVGNAAEAMVRLRQAELDGVIRQLRRPVLGICVGMQLLCRHSEEGDAACLGIFDTRVRRFVAGPGTKVPHMGWNRIDNLESKLFRGIEEGTYLYFVHSYYPECCSDTVATALHGVLFSAALKYENFYGTQFHPEKSGDAGERILANFLTL